MYQSTDSSEWRWSAYINRRLNRLSGVLGPEAMRQARDEAIASFRERQPKLTDEDWLVFTKGTEEEQEAWRDKVFREEEAAEQAKSKRGMATCDCFPELGVRPCGRRAFATLTYPDPEILGHDEDRWLCLEHLSVVLEGLKRDGYQPSQEPSPSSKNSLTTGALF